MFRLLLIVSLFFSFCCNAHAQYKRVYKSIATNLNPNKRGYVADITEYTDFENRLQYTETFYYDDLTNQKIAYRKTTFKDKPFTPNYVFENYRNGASEVVLVKDDTLYIYYQANKDAVPEKKVMPVPENLVVEAGLSELIKSKIPQLMAGEKVKLNIVAPVRLNYYEFMIYMDGKKGTNKYNNMVVKFVSTNWFVRAILDPIEIGIDINTKKLTHYMGTTNLIDSNGDMIKASIEYDYQP